MEILKGTTVKSIKVIELYNSLDWRIISFYNLLQKGFAKFVKMRVGAIFNAALVVGANAATTWTVGQEVKTTSGIVHGRAATRPGYSDVSEYVGIPFAHPPVGELRWMPAEPFVSNGKIDATKWVGTD
jgi:hypothetical protein